MESAFTVRRKINFLIPKHLLQSQKREQLIQGRFMSADQMHIQHLLE
jgi:hypothetical protein